MTYGIDLDHAISGKHTPNHVGALIAYLPTNAYIKQEVNDDASWTREETILASIQNNLRGLIYGMTPKSKRGAEPKPLGPSWMTREKMQKLPARAMPIEELMKVLEKPRSNNG